MDTLTKKDKLTLQVSLALVAGMFSLVPVAQGAPVLENVVSGGAIIKTSANSANTGTNTAITSKELNNVINWKDFSIANGESVTFDGGAKTIEAGAHNYLNVVTGNGTSYINGEMKGGNDVYLVNPQGVIMGEKANIDVGNLYVSTRDLSGLNNIIKGDENWDGSASILDSSKVVSEVVNMGKIQANSVYAEGTSVTFTNTKNVTSDGSTLLGDVTLNGMDYVHVGYEATASVASNKNTSSTHYKTPDATNSASKLGYTINGSTKTENNFAKGVNDYDFALVRNDYELQAMSSNLAINYMLNVSTEEKEIDLGTHYPSSTPFSPIGGTSAFTGNFDGNFHTIKNLNNTTAANTYTGLFGRVGSESKRSSIMNVGVVNARLLGKGNGYTGGIAGYIYNTDLKNVYNKSTGSGEIADSLTGSKKIDGVLYTYYEGSVGGIVGYAGGGSHIESVYNTSEVKNGAGLVGKLESSSIKNAYNSGLVTNNKDYVYNTKTLDEHYAIADVISSSTVENVYGSSSYKKVSQTGTTTLNSVSLANATGDFKKAYVIDSSTLKVKEAYGDTTSANSLSNGGTYNKSDASAKRAANFGFFDSTLTAGEYITASKSKDGAWRIYDKYTLPLLRSFLRANGNGTVPVSYTYALYANKEGGSSVGELNGSNADGTVTYNSYYIDVANVTTDKVRNLNADKIGFADSEREKDVGKSLSAFYIKSDSTHNAQDGYDLAGDSLQIVPRNLAPKSSRDDINKVYDGTSDATTALGDGLLQKIDLRKYKTDPGYGIVEVYETKASNTPLRVDKVAINVGTVDSDGNITPGTGFITSATYDDGPNVTQDSHITFVTNPDVEALTGEDAGNYILKGSDLEGIKFTGDITPRPVYVDLKTEAKNQSKTYDGTSVITHNGTTSVEVDENGEAVLDENGKVQYKHTTNDITVTTKEEEKNSGFIGTDGVSLKVSDAYFADDNGNKVTNANPVDDKGKATSSYNAVYALALSGNNSKFSNYVLMDASQISQNIDKKVALANNTLTTKGVINRRNVSLKDVTIWNGEEKITTATKTYDFTSDFKGATGVSFSVGDGVSVARAVNQKDTMGVLEADADKFDFSLGSATFYTGDKTEDANATAAKTVSAAKKVQYLLTPDDPDMLTNYTINKNTITSTGVEYYGDGKIEKRAIDIGMYSNSGIDKYYDGSADVVDKNDAKGYLVFRNSGASSNVAETPVAPNVTNIDKGYVGYTTDTANKLVVDDTKGGVSLNDGTYFGIEAVYTTNGVDGGTTDKAEDVYYNPSDPANGKDKKITYTVTLKGDFADNYTLNGNSATVSGDSTAGPQVELEASGAIDPRKITGITFDNVSKVYDGSDQVGEVNGVTQANNKIKVTGVVLDDSDGVTMNKSVDEVLGTTGNVVTTNSIKGTYGNRNGDTFTADAHAHWNGTDTDTSNNPVGKSRDVQYTGVSTITGSNHNYTIVGIEDTQYGKGRIDPLTIESLSASGDGKISKIYDGTANVVGGYQIKYDTSTEHNTGGEEDIVGVLKKHKNDASDVQAALGTITGTGKGVNGEAIEVKFGNVNDAVANYTVDAGNTIYNSTHVNEANNITYAISFANPGTDDIDFALKSSDDANANGYTSYGTNGAKIVKDTGSGIITARNIYTQGKTGLSKTYDGDNIVKDSNGSKMTGENVVEFNLKDDISGLVGIDNVTNVSEAVYSGDTRTGFQTADANVYSDGVHTTADGAKYVTYTVKLSDNNVHGDYVIYKNTNGDTYYAPGDTYKLSGNNIEQKEMEIGFKGIAKKYDTNDKVLGVTLTTGIDADSTGAVEGNTVTLTGTVNGDSVKLAIQDTSAFLKDTANNLAAADVGDHKVRYDLVSNSADLKNYHLIPKDSSNPVTVTKNNDGTYNVTVYGTGKIDPLTIEAITAAIEAVTKVYDGNASLTYNHTFNDSSNNGITGYDSTQVGSATSADKVGTIKLGNLELQANTGKYTVNDNSVTVGDKTVEGTHFADANAGTGKTVTYSISLSSDVVKNLTIDKDKVKQNDSTITVYGDKNSGYVITKTEGGNTILAKNAYAYLTTDGENANPTKIYDGNTDVKSSYNGFVDVAGRVNNTGSYAVSAAYENQNVEVETVDGKTTPKEKANKIDYTVTADNYNIYTMDDSGNIFTYNTDNHAKTDTTYNYSADNGNITKDENPVAVLGSANKMSDLVNSTNVLVGDGTIEQKAITFDASYAKKTYDASADVNLAKKEDSDEAPAFTLTGLVNNNDVTIAASGDKSIKGEYVSLKDGTYVADENVALDANSEPTYKAVRYANVAGSLTNGESLATNYKIVSGSDYTYDSATDSLVFAADKQKGLIDKRGIKQFTSSWETISKEYDANELVLNPTDSFKVWGVYNLGADNTLGTADDGKVSVGYNLEKAVYGTLNDTKDGLASTSKNVGTGLNVSYQISGLKAESLQNFKLDKGVTADGYNKWFTTNTGEIIQRVISGTTTSALQEKIYDGGKKTDTTASTNPDSYNKYFKIDDDDLKVLSDDEDVKVSDLAVTGTYDNKNYSISPTDTATGKKDVYYKVGWADGNARSNYTFDNGDDKVSGNYTGKGDIHQRVVYVTDTGGDLEQKVYNGKENLVDANGQEKAVSPTKFEDKTADSTTGIVDADVSLSPVVNGAYDGKDVLRDSNGNVVNKAVHYSGFALTDAKSDGNDDSGNYYLMADKDIKSVTLNDGTTSKVSASGEDKNLVITEETGGLIKPKEITLSIDSVSKEYDADDAVKDGSNLTAKADGESITKTYHSANGASFQINPGNGLEEFEVTIDSGKYDNKNVSVNEAGEVQKDKETTYNVTWHNGNYDLVGEMTPTETDPVVKGQNKDTFVTTDYGKTGDTVTRKGTLKDYQGEITPRVLTIESMSGSKTYDGNTGYSYGTAESPSSNQVKVSFGEVSDDVIAKDVKIEDGKNINDLLKLTVAKGIYDGATDQAKADALAAGVSQEDIDAGTASDAAFDEKSGSFEHSVKFEGIDVGNPNYKLSSDSFDDGTGIINRAAVTAHASSGNMYTGSSLPSFTGYFTGFVPGEKVTTTIKEPVTTTTVDTNGNEVTETTYVDKVVTMPWADYYKDYFTWGPDSNIDTSKVGTNPVYGWYRKTVNGVEGLYKSSNLGKNYVLAQDPGTLTLTRYYASDSSGGSGGYNGKSSATTVVLQPASSAPVAKTETAAANNVVPAPVVEALTTGYVEKPTTPDSSVYQNVSKDNSNTGSHEGKASIQYGDSTTTLDSSDGSSSGTIGIEVAEVVNLLGDDVASDGTMSLTNTGDGQALSVESTENGYLSVGSAGSEGSIGIETEGGIVSADNGEREGTIGLETEGSLLNADNGEKEGTISLETEEGVLNANGTDKEGTIGLETEDEVLLDTEQGKELLSTTSSDEESGTTKEGSISIKSSSKDGEAEITSAGSRLAKADEVQKKDEDKDKEDEEEKNSEEESNKEGEAAIAYSDVA